MHSSECPECRHPDREHHRLHEHPGEADIMPAESREHLAQDECPDDPALDREGLGEGASRRRRRDF